MSLETDIERLLKAEGFGITEVVRDAINDLMEVVQDENEDLPDDHDYGEDPDVDYEDD